MKTFIGTVIFALVIGTSANVFAQKIENGMSRSQLEKLIPRYAKQFMGTEPQVKIEDFNFHGMKGTVSFVFKSDRLYLFSWEYPSSAIMQAEVAQYNKVLKGLEETYGPGKSRTSAYNPNIEERYWRLPNTLAHTSYSQHGFKFLLADSTWIESVMGGSHNQ